MRKYLAIPLTVLLMAAAFFLPEQISRWNDEMLLNDLHIMQEEEREGFAESLRLPVGEKLMMMQSGTLDTLWLSSEDLPVDSEVQKSNASISGGDEEEVEFLFSNIDVDLSDEAAQKWQDRLTAVQAELRSLQAMGGMPVLWDAETEATLIDCSQVLYIDSATQISFLVYNMDLIGGSYRIDLKVDAQTGRILSFYLTWGGGQSLIWGPRNAASFGAVWRDYWGLDSVDAGWYSNYIKNILENMAEIMRMDGPYNSNAQIAFNYNGQALNIPLVNWAYSERDYALLWNP